MSPRAHDVVMLERQAVGHWIIRCSCFQSIAGVDPIDVHRKHQDHVVAEFLAEESGVERASA
jgi:hypothetical protein